MKTPKWRLNVINNLKYCLLFFLYKVEEETVVPDHLLQDMMCVFARRAGTPLLFYLEGKQ
jgi:hypothetical protein